MSYDTVRWIVHIILYTLVSDEPPIAYAFFQVDDASERFPDKLSGKD